MFEMFQNMVPYSTRKVDRHENHKEGLTISTAAIVDSDGGKFETGITHPAYNEGAWVIVEEYKTKKKAQKGHNKWVKVMTAKKLPETLKDRSGSSAAEMLDGMGEDWRSYKKEEA